MSDNKSFFASNKQVIVPTVVMLLICIVVTGALAGTNLLTKTKIKEIEKSQENESMAEVLKADTYKEVKDKDKTYNIAKNGDKTVGYIFVTTEKGYGGEVKVMTGIKPDGKISAVKVLDATTETPGLGQNTGKEEWYKQYGGLSAKSEVKVVKSGASKKDNNVDAVTGATISSKAVTKAVNNAVDLYNEIVKKGDGANE